MDYLLSHTDVHHRETAETEGISALKDGQGRWSFVSSPFRSLPKSPLNLWVKFCLDSDTLWDIERQGFVPLFDGPLFRCSFYLAGFTFDSGSKYDILLLLDNNFFSSLRAPFSLSFKLCDGVLPSIVWFKRHGEMLS